MHFLTIVGIITLSVLVIICGEVVWFWEQIAEEQGNDQ